MKIEREIKNDHLARIEGKAGVVVEIGDEIRARINVTEGPRFFEILTKEKNYVMRRQQLFAPVSAAFVPYPISSRPWKR